MLEGKELFRPDPLLFNYGFLANAVLTTAEAV